MASHTDVSQEGEVYKLTAMGAALKLIKRVVRRRSSIHT
jgi:hypothetical protein